MKRLGWIGLALIFAAASAAAAWTLYRFPPVEWPFYPRCMFHQISGCLCPGCGSLRAIHLLLHGQLQTAVLHVVFGAHLKRLDFVAA